MKSCSDRLQFILHAESRQYSSILQISDSCSSPLAHSSHATPLPWPGPAGAAAPARLLPPAGERRPRWPHSSLTGPAPFRIPAAAAATSSPNGREWSTLFPNDPGESAATHGPPQQHSYLCLRTGPRGKAVLTVCVCVARTRGKAAPHRETLRAKILRDFYRPVFLYLQQWGMFLVLLLQRFCPGSTFCPGIPGSRELNQAIGF